MNIENGVTLSTQPDGILLGRGLARALNVKPGDRVTLLGNTVHGSLNAVDLTVTGIFHTGAKEFDDVVFRIPLKQAQTLLDTEKVETIAIGLNDKNWEQNWKKLVQDTERKLPELETVPFAKLDEVYYQHSVDWLNQQFVVIEAIILAIIILGIFNSVSTGILERRQEIGNLRANGESTWDVTRLLTTEGILLGIFASFAGIVLAWLLNATLLKNGILMPPAPGLTRQFYVRIELQFLSAVKTFLMGTSVAVVATFVAAWRVVKTPIAEALRSV
jgi:putative ABC transport system permease protein